MPETKAKIVFSDGSKQMAHNLDDLRERWELRRRAESAIRYAPYEPINEPDYKNPVSLEQAEEWSVVLSSAVAVLKVKINTLTGERKSLSPAVYDAYHGTLQSELDYRNEAVAWVNLRIKQFEREMVAVRRAEKDAKRDAIMSVKREQHAALMAEQLKIRGQAVQNNQDLPPGMIEQRDLASIYLSQLNAANAQVRIERAKNDALMEKLATGLEISKDEAKVLIMFRSRAWYKLLFYIAGNMEREQQENIASVNTETQAPQESK